MILFHRIVTHFVVAVVVCVFCVHFIYSNRYVFSKKEFVAFEADRLVRYNKDIARNFILKHVIFDVAALLRDNRSLDSSDGDLEERILQRINYSLSRSAGSDISCHEMTNQSADFELFLLQSEIDTDKVTSVISRSISNLEELTDKTVNVRFSDISVKKLGRDRIIKITGSFRWDFTSTHQYNSLWLLDSKLYPGSEEGNGIFAKIMDEIDRNCDLFH